MASRFNSVGEIRIRGKAAKIVLDPQGKDPVRFFCFVEDLDKMLSDPSRYVRVYRDNDEGF